MGLGHHRGDPAHVEVLATRAGFARQAFVHIALDWRFPKAAVGGVDGEFLGVFGHAQLGVGQHELAHHRVERETGHAIANAQHQHGGGAVQGVTGGNLAGTRLEEIGLGQRPALGGGVGCTQHTENAAHRHVHVDVAGAVQRVKHQQVFATGVLRWNVVGQVHLFRRHARQMTAPLVHADEQLVAHHVEFFLGFALHVDAAACVGRMVAIHVGQGAIGHRFGNGFAGHGHVQNQGIEVATCVRKAAALFDQVLRQGGRGAGAQGHGANTL